MHRNIIQSQLKMYGYQGEVFHIGKLSDPIL